jgi:peptidoglycan/LPS O-acetylase OafA/YrhL
MEKKLKHLYFPNLNAVRAIAAIMVIIFHVELIKSEYNRTNWVKYVQLGGDLGVILFFVLSGYLITYLLLKEKEMTGFISLKDFYVRRILRIWPLYMLVVLLCLFVFPYIPFLNEPPLSSMLSRPLQIFFYLFFMANVLTGFSSHVNYARPTWSVAVEEQFYLLWPLLIRRAKNPARTIFYVFAAYWIVKIGLIVASSNTFSQRWNIPYIKNIQSVWDYTPFDALSIGGMAAYAYFKKSSLLAFLYRKEVQLAVFFMPACIYLFRMEFFIESLVYVKMSNTVYAAIFAVMILNLSGNEQVIINLENKIMIFLGKISYGLYLYHWVVVVFVINFISKFIPVDPENIILYNGMLYFLVFALTILIASLSYYGFELRFLKIKQKYSKLVSGDFAKAK